MLPAAWRTRNDNVLGRSPFLLDVRNLTCLHPGSDRGMRDVSFKVARGSFTVITGQIGSGKTMLLPAVLGLCPRMAARSAGTGSR